MNGIVGSARWQSFRSLGGQIPEWSWYLAGDEECLVAETRFYDWIR